jgi:cellulose biosynthesis protein BcsQ
MTTIAFFNNKGGVGKTSLAYHLAWMFADRGLRIVAADLDPQANLTSMFLEEDRLEALWPEGAHPETILGCVDPLIEGTGDVKPTPVAQVEPGIALLPGDLGLSSFEDALSDSWPRCLAGDRRAFRVTSAFSRVIAAAVVEQKADLAVVDVGPNLGAINRAALISADYVVIPLGPDLFSLQGLRNLGPTLIRWRADWQQRLARNTEPSLLLPGGRMQPVGYVMMRHSIRLDRPVKAYARWIERMPGVYRSSVLNQSPATAPAMADDPNCLVQMKDYRSLMPMSQESNKPMFFLKPADGAIGGHQAAVRDCYADFRQLARRIGKECGFHVS